MMTPEEQRAFNAMSPEERLAYLGLEGEIVLPKVNGARADHDEPSSEITPAKPVEIVPLKSNGGDKPRPNGSADYNGGAGASNQKAPSKFVLIPYEKIIFSANEEWLIKRFLPREGVALLYGKPQTLKSFTALDIGLRAATGRSWAGRRTERVAVVYLCCEGAGGFLKRMAGSRLAHSDWPDILPFHLIRTAPNLGGQKSDLPELIAAIEGAGVKPGLIVIDTLAQTLGGAEENGVGMVTFLSNSNVLASYFKALVLPVHHVGLAKHEQKRPRGHSSIGGGVDAQILVERAEGELSTTLILQKLKDEEANVRFEVTLARRVIEYDEDHEEISTLVVESVEDAAPAKTAKEPGRWPPSLRLFRQVLLEAIGDQGADRSVGLNGPTVRMVDPEKVRALFYRRYATGEDGEARSHNAKKKAFAYKLKSALDAGLASAQETSEGEFVWLS